MDNGIIKSKLDLDLLLIYYHFSDQYGVVDIKAASSWAKNRLGVFIPQTPVTLKQSDLDILTEKGLISDIREIMGKLNVK